MSRVVWLDGEIVDAAAAALPIDDPAVRHGEGLFETMRGQDGRVPLLDRHLTRLAASAAALGLAVPDPWTVRGAVTAVAARLGPGAARIRVSVTPRPTLLVEGAPTVVDPHARLRAVTVRGAWHPGRALAEHKTLSYIECRLAQRQAEQAGADIALLLDASGRVGEASIANVMCVIDGRIVTPPARGLLPGIARALVTELASVTQVDLVEEVWRGAEEVFTTNALRGVQGIDSVDGTPLPGRHPVTDELARRVEAALSGVPLHE